MNALVLGAGGQLGTELVRLLGTESAVPHAALSITDRAAVEAFIGERRPDVAFNCAAYNAVDRAEVDPEAALLVNRDGPENVALACAAHGVRMVHFSTNFVFDGALDRPYVESDRPRPLGRYGFSKLAGERAVQAANPQAIVVRTAAVYGNVGTGFPERIVERGRAHGEVEVVTDQFVNPTYARDLAVRLLELPSDLAGVIHLTGGGCCSWHEFARAALDEAGVVAEVRPVTSDRWPGRAQRPANGCLESTRIAALRPWREALQEWGRTAKNP